VLVTDADSLYAAGQRGGVWRKVKPLCTYDLVVLGAEWGHGGRRGWLSNLHLGARDPRTGDFVMVGKCFKGADRRAPALADGGAAGPREHAQGDRRPRPPRAGGRDRARRRPVVHRYPGGLALRFAQVKRYRPDKSAADADTIDDQRALLPARW
jgi:DNA ligase-1